jgi:hypothetical protein
MTARGVIYAPTTARPFRMSLWIFKTNASVREQTKMHCVSASWVVDQAKAARLPTGFFPPPDRYGCDRSDARWMRRTKCFS